MLVLIVCAYVGACVDNLLLCYLCTLFVAMYPGLQTHGFVQTLQTKVCAFVGTHLTFLKQKVSAVAAGAPADAADGKKKE